MLLLLLLVVVVVIMTTNIIIAGPWCHRRSRPVGSSCLAVSQSTMKPFHLQEHPLTCNDILQHTRHPFNIQANPSIYPEILHCSRKCFNLRKSFNACEPALCGLGARGARPRFAESFCRFAAFEELNKLYRIIHSPLLPVRYI